MIQKSHDKKEARIAIFPGSFNPFTVGHASIVERSLPLFDQIIICIGYNYTKGEDSANKAKEIANTISELYRDDARVKVIADAGLTVDVARRFGAGFIVRGVRSTVDFEYERNMADINREIAGIETVLLPALPELAAVSSSMVRELKHFGVDVSPYIPKK